MAEPSRKRIVRTLLDRYGRTYAGEAGIRIDRNTPAPLFQTLNMALLQSARIPADNAMRATRALIDAGLTTPRQMADATWQDRVDVITAHGYKRYDERTATMLGDTAQRMLDDFDGDLRNLRAQCGRDAGRERKMLQRFSGIGETGADIFLREVQTAWPEAYPYADKRVAKGARALGLPARAADLAKLVPRREFARFAAALVRVDLDRGYDDVLDAA